MLLLHWILHLLRTWQRLWCVRGYLWLLVISPCHAKAVAAPYATSAALLDKGCGYIHPSGRGILGHLLSVEHLHTSPFLQPPPLGAAESCCVGRCCAGLCFSIGCYAWLDFLKGIAAENSSRHNAVCVG